MNLKEFKERIDFLYAHARHPEDVKVVITTSEPCYVGREKADIEGVSLGFDFENGQVRIDPKQKLIKWNKEK